MFSKINSIPHLRTIATVLLVAVLAGLVILRVLGHRKAVAPSPTPPLVRLTELAPATELETKSFPGVSKESQIAKLSFRIPGKMIETNILIGARFPKDEIIARLDPRDYVLAVERLESELLSAQASLTAMVVGARPEDIASLEAKLKAADSAFLTARTNLKRFTALLADQVAAQSQYDLVKTQYDTVKGERETLQNELKKAKTGSRKEDIESAAAKIEALKASLDTAKNAVNDTLLKAPFDGMIVEKYVEDHEVVGAGSPILSFVDVSKIDIAVSLPEEIIVRMSDIRDYRVEFESYPGKVFPATLKEIGQAIQFGRQSYPLQVRIDLAKYGDEKQPLFPGMTAMVFLDLARPTAPPLTVPLAALFGEKDNTAVWTVAQSDGNTFKVVRKPVHLLRIVGTAAEIECDLKSAEKIVAAGARSLHEGQTVVLE